MAITTINDLQIVPAKFTEYTIQRTNEKSMLVRSGLAVSNPTVANVINGTPKGGNEIRMPHFNPLEGEGQVFGVKELTANKITTGVEKATLLVREVMWGDNDLARVFGGVDPMNAIVNQYADWRIIQEQNTIVSILKGIFTSALSSHVNDISEVSGTGSIISFNAAIDTMQLLGDAKDSLGVVFMHSAVEAYLTKQQAIIQTFDPTTQTFIKTYANCRVIVDDGLPYEDGVFNTYFMAQGVIARDEGVPQGLVTTETFRKNTLAENYLIYRYAMVLHPMGLSFTNFGPYTDSESNTYYYADNSDLATAANWALVTNHKNVKMAVLKHRIDEATLGSFVVNSVAGTESGTSVISIVGATPAGTESVVYKTAASTAPSVTYDADLTSWTDLPSDGIITATNGHKITVAIVNASGMARKAGNTTVVSAT